MQINSKGHSKTLLFGGSGFFGPVVLERFPDIVSVGRTPLHTGLANKHINLESVDDLGILDDLDFDKILFLIGNSNHHKINGEVMMGIDYNVIPLKKILFYLKTRKRKIHKFIVFTGALLYDVNKIKLPVNESQPINPYVNEYVFSKYLSEEIIKLYPEIPTIVVRLSNIYGPTRLIRPDLVPTLVQQVLSPNDPEVWSTKPERDFIYAKDAAEAVVSLLDTGHTGPINVGSGTINSVGKVVEILERLSGKKIKDLDIPVTGPMKFQYDISTLRKLTGFTPHYSLESGLEETYNIMKEYAQKERWWEKNV